MTPTSLPAVRAFSPAFRSLLLPRLTSAFSGAHSSSAAHKSSGFQNNIAKSHLIIPCPIFGSRAYTLTRGVVFGFWDGADDLPRKLARKLLFAVQFRQRGAGASFQMICRQSSGINAVRIGHRPLTGSAGIDITHSFTAPGAAYRTRAAFSAVLPLLTSMVFIHDGVNLSGISAGSEPAANGTSGEPIAITVLRQMLQRRFYTSSRRDKTGLRRDLTWRSGKYQYPFVAQKILRNVGLPVGGVNIRSMILRRYC